MRWAEIKTVTTEQAADLVANIMIEEGCGGVAITGPSVCASECSQLTCYLPVDDRLEGRLQNIRDRIRLLPKTGLDIGPGEITVTWIDDADWAEAWKSFFKPVKVGRVLIKPSWEDVEGGRDSVRAIVEIDPGMAFGTGNHPTTRLCLLALQKHLRGGERVLDVGTGSGILAITAAKLGAAEVTATEFDPVAVEAAIENVRRNGVGERVHIVQSESPAVAPPADLAVANITANVIIELAGELGRAVAPGGTLVVSGLIDERADEVARKLEEVGFGVVERMEEDGWVAIVLVRNDQLRL